MVGGIGRQPVNKKTNKKTRGKQSNLGVFEVKRHTHRKGAKSSRQAKPKPWITEQWLASALI